MKINENSRRLLQPNHSGCKLKKTSSIPKMDGQKSTTQKKKATIKKSRDRSTSHRGKYDVEKLTPGKKKSEFYFNHKTPKKEKPKRKKILSKRRRTLHYLIPIERSLEGRGFWKGSFQEKFQHESQRKVLENEKRSCEKNKLDAEQGGK